MAAIGTGSGKLILFGEHAAVFGHPAIGVQLPERTTVAIDGPGRDTWDLEAVAEEDRHIVQQLLERLETLLPELARRGRKAVGVESSVPRGVGLGSSAALCSAAAGAALQMLGENPGASGSRRTWELAHELERLFHGTPSGIDTGLSLHAGLTAYTPRPPALPRWEQVPTASLWLVVGALPRALGSGALIRGVGDRMRAGETRVSEALSALGTIALQAREALARTVPAGGHEATVGRLAETAMGILRSLGLSDPALDMLLEEGKRWGALGGKLSGAGGGGAFFLVLEGEASARTTAVRLGEAARSHDIGFVLAPRAVRVGR